MNITFIGLGIMGTDLIVQLPLPEMAKILKTLPSQL